MFKNLDEIRSALAALTESNTESRSVAIARDRILTKPPGSLGRLEEIAIWLAGWQSRQPLRIVNPAICLFAGNHGVARYGVSPYPSAVTAQMVSNFATGGAAINQLSGVFGIQLSVHQPGNLCPTQDFTLAPALSEVECLAAINCGAAAIPTNCDLLGLGEMGIGNTTVAAAIHAALFAANAEQFVGRGTGADDAMLRRKVDVVCQALSLHQGHLDDPLEVLRRLGGHEIAALFGAILAARLRRIPVVLDGYVVAAAATILQRANAAAIDHCLAGHVSAEFAHADVLRRLGFSPLLSLGMRLGEGSGAALAMSIVMAAVKCHSCMASFSEAGVSDREPLGQEVEREAAE